MPQIQTINDMQTSSPPEFTVAAVETEQDFLRVFPLLKQLAELEVPENLEKMTASHGWTTYRKSMMEQYRLYAAGNEDTILAVMGIRILHDPFDIGGPYAVINNLVVDKVLRGQGIGTKLLREAEKICRQAGCAVMIINVLKTNDRARALYEGLGYAPPVAEIMVKEL